MTLILKFDSADLRESFLEKLARERSDILAECRSNPLVPQVTAQVSSDDQIDWLRRNIGEYGHAFEDVRFRSF